MWHVRKKAWERGMAWEAERVLGRVKGQGQGRDREEQRIHTQREREREREREK